MRREILYNVQDFPAVDEVGGERLMQRLLVVFTGGTIGSRRREQTINVADEGSYALLEEYARQSFRRDDVLLDTLQPLNLLSENITPDDWRLLAAAIREVDCSSYAGIIVTHGSDTLAYSAAMMSYLFADIHLPLVLTASNYPIADERSNGLRNFGHSIDFIAESALPGVFVVYENNKGEAAVYLGTRITQCEPFTDQFGSPYDVVYGFMVDRRFEWQANERNPRPESLQPRKLPFDWSSPTLRLASGIMYIKPYPGLNYDCYSFAGQKPRAVLHDLHHSGTACAVESGPYSLLRFIEQCRANGIDFYICPIKDASAAMYSSSVKLIEAGATVIENMSIEAAITKMMLAYGLYEEEKQARLFIKDVSVYYEHCVIHPV